MSESKLSKSDYPKNRTKDNEIKEDGVVGTSYTIETEDRSTDVQRSKTEDRSDRRSKRQKIEVQKCRGVRHPPRKELLYNDI